MEAAWVGAIGAGAFLAGAALSGLLGWWRLRRVKRAHEARMEAEQWAHHRRVSGLRAELVAAAAARALNARQGDTQPDEPAGEPAPEPAGEPAPEPAGEPAPRAPEAAELQELRERLAIYEPQVEEIELLRLYVETLQRELTYRDERSNQLTAGPGVSGVGLERSAGQLGNAGFDEPPVEEIGERDACNL